MKRTLVVGFPTLFIGVTELALQRHRLWRAAAES